MGQFLPVNLRKNSWLATVLCLLPIILYIWIFSSNALNVNYIAFDDILILSVIPKFEGASISEKWNLLTQLFPEHRLVFSRLIILGLYNLFGTVNLVWAMIVASLCWLGCFLVFYQVFRKQNLSLWYLVPIAWIWFSIQSYENMFWGVSSLCNFGVLLFAIGSIYSVTFCKRGLIPGYLLAIMATYTYGNGMAVFLILGFIVLVQRRYVSFWATLILANIVSAVYFRNFSIITPSMDLRDPDQVVQGILGFFGFLGSIFTLKANGNSDWQLGLAVAGGVMITGWGVFLLFKKRSRIWQMIRQEETFSNNTALFAVALTLFIGVTAAALTYKRIPTDEFVGMFKGRYRMYSALLIVALYFLFLARSSFQTRERYLVFLIPAAIVLNLGILISNISDIKNFRTMAIAQEFNARYNEDWYGLNMFGMSQDKFEEIRALYASADPVAEGWDPRRHSNEIICDSLVTPEAFIVSDEYVDIQFGNLSASFEKSRTDGVYLILKSNTHTYLAAGARGRAPLKTMIRRGIYYNRRVNTKFFKGTLAPGNYKIYLLLRNKDTNKIYCTGKTWEQ